MKNVETLTAKIFDTAVRVLGLDFPNDAEVSVLLVDKGAMQELNERYRGKNHPTNVLSFETGDKRLVGDIVLCLPVIDEEAYAQGKKSDEHLAHMILHGILHLLGYDHERRGDAEKMEEAEVRILKELGIGNPYEE